VLAGSFQLRKQHAATVASSAAAAARKASNSTRPLTVVRSTLPPESSGTPDTLGDASVNPTGAAAAAAASGDEDADAFRLELEKLQVETIYSLVEKIELPSGKLNMLFLTNDQARQFDFTDIDKVTRAMDINPKPKLIININKSPNSLGATTYHDCCGITGCPGAAFTDSLYVAEPDNAHLVETNQKMAMFLKEHLLPVCIKTNAVVFIHNDTCAISTIFGAICKAEQSRRHGKLPFTVCSVSGGHSVVMKAEYTPESIAYKICHGSRRWGQHKAEMLALFKTETLLDMPNNDFTGEISRE
jgi:hypothetical protein